MTRNIYLSALAIAAGALCATAAMAQAPQLPDKVAAPGATTIATFQGVGAQVYECKECKTGSDIKECKAGGDTKLAWVFREPIATLIENGKTVGRHYAVAWRDVDGSKSVRPAWEDVDGSKIVGEVVGRAPGATSDDIPWLKLDVVNHQRRGIFFKVTTVQRLDTHGGALSGSCDKAGDFKSVAYSATYVFLRKGR